MFVVFCGTIAFMKYLVGLLAGISLSAIAIVIFLAQKSLNTIPTPSVSPQATDVVTATASAAIMPTPIVAVTATASGTPSATEGKTVGKLCYPSQFLPAGAIEAKDTTTKVVTSQNYAGTNGGATSSYSLSLPVGKYILRYKAIPDPNTPQNALYGYHTDVCPTGLETTCTATNKRKHIEVEVKAGLTVAGVDLCDFYYDKSFDPGF